MSDLNTKPKCCMAMYCIFSDDNEHCEAYKDCITDGCPYLHAIDEIARLSLLLDIVKCKDCEHMHSGVCFHPKQAMGLNSFGGECLLVDDNDFCSYGKLKQSDV